MNRWFFQYLFIFILSFLFVAENVFAACSTPTASAGARKYFTAEKKYKYCNGTNWYVMQNGGLQLVATISGTAIANFAGANSTVVSGTYVYTVGSSKFSITDISNQADPQIIKTTTDATFGTQIAVYGNYAYISATNSIQVWNITTKTNPTYVTTLTDATNLPSIQKIVPYGNYLYVLATQRLTIVDLSTPSAPTVAGSVNHGTYLNGAAGVDISGNYAVVAAQTYQGVAVIDVTTKTAPTIVGQYSNGTVMNGVADVKISANGNYAYTAGQTSDTVACIDITTKSAPTLASSLTNALYFDGVRSLAIKGNLLFAASNSPTSGYATMMTLDLTLPASPVILANNNPGLGYNPYSLSISNNTLVALSNAGGRLLMIYDLSARQYYKQQDSIAVRGTFFLTADIDVVSNTAVYLDNDEILYAYDVSNPANPIAKGTVYLPTWSSRSGSAVAFDGSYAYTGSSNAGRVTVINMTNINKPVLVGSNTAINQVYGLDVAGNYVFSVGFGGFDVVDVTTKSNPTIVGNAPVSGTPKAVKVVGNYAYVVTPSQNKLSIVDMSVKNFPIVVSNLVDNTNLAGAMSIDVQGNYAYIAATGRMTTIDISNAFAPVFSTSLVHANFSSLSKVRVNSNGTTLSLLGYSLSTINLTNPASPTYAGNYSGAGGNNTGGLAVVSGAVIVGTYNFPSIMETFGVASTPTFLSMTYGPSVYSSSVGGISASGSYAFVTSNNSFFSFNITDPTSPTMVSQFTDATKLLAGQKNDIIGNKVYTVGNGYITAMNITTPTSTTLSGYTANANLANAKTIKVISGYAFVGGDNLTVLDISVANPAYLQTRTHASMGSCGAMDISGNYLYMSCSTNGAFYIFDISDPTFPVMVGVYVNSTALSGHYNSMVVTNNSAFIAKNGGAVVMDVTDPTAPGFVTAMNTTCFTITKTNYTNRIICRNSTQALTIDVSYPGSPAIIYTTLSDGNPWNSYLFGNLHLSYVGGGIQIGELASTGYLGEPTRFTGDIPLTSARGIDVVGNLAYISTGNNNLSIYDVSNIASATLLSQKFIGDANTGTNSAYDLVVSGNYAHVARGALNGVSLIDISDSTNPVRKSSYSRISTWASLEFTKLIGGYMFGGTNGFASHNVASPTAAVAMASITDVTNLNTIKGFDYSGSNAYICSSGTNKLTAVNISNPSSLTVTSSITDNTRFAGCRTVSVSGTYAYIIGQTNGYFTAVDISNPASMVVAGSILDVSSFGGTAVDMAVSGSQVIYTNQTRLTSVNISAPASPVISDYYTIAGTPTFMKVYGNYVYVAHNGTGTIGVYNIAQPISLGACTVAGQLEYNSATKSLKMCNGTDYYALTPDGVGGAGCTSPTAKINALDYNSTTNVYRYCDGTSWVQIGPY
ncbi:hypothetical protein CIK05_04230 [Bdellovibrio sp. qaytius]|nr:hypothetical protein CIK05_04230 [Bdellovibrio sp. qaytius]